MIKLTNNYQVLIILFLSYTLTHIVGTGNRSSVLLLAIYDAAQRSQLAKTHSQSTKKSGKNYLIFKFKEMCTSKLKKVIKKSRMKKTKWYSQLFLKDLLRLFSCLWCYLLNIMNVILVFSLVTLTLFWCWRCKKNKL